MIRIIFLGPPGSGKGTQANLVSTKYKIPNISAGEVLRKSFSNRTLLLNDYICTNATSIINSGNLVDDELVIKLVIDRINQNDCVNGFVLDGFPRTIMQAQSLNQYNIDFVIEFYIPDNIIIDRIVGRQIHLESGRTYHVKFNPPKCYGVDDITGEQLITRKDDNKQIIQKRLCQYQKYITKIATYYSKIEKLNNLLRYFKIDGNRQITQIYTELIYIFETYKLIK